MIELADFLGSTLGITFDFFQAAIAIGIVLASIVLADIVIVLLDKVVKPFLSRTKTTFDDRIFDAIRGPIKLFFFVFGLYFAANYISPAMKIAGRTTDELLVLALIVAGGHAVAEIVDGIVDWFYHDITPETSRLKKSIDVSRDVFPITRKIVRIAIYVATLIILLNQLGIEITPLLAGLGVASLAVGLALQDTLSNFFAGLYLLSDKPIRAGNFVALDSEDSKVKGEVVEIGWRSTKIKNPAGFVYVIPNSKVASSIVANLETGGDGYAATVNVGAEYGTPAEKVEKALVQAVKNATKKDANIVKGFEPLVRFANYGESALEFAVIFKVKKYWDQHAAATEVRKEIQKEFKKAGIGIPFPIRTVYLKK